MAVNTVVGLMWLAAPRSSPAPHFEGHRSFSAGGDQEGACWATAADIASAAAEKAAGSVKRLMGVPPLTLVRTNPVPVQRAERSFFADV
jgi:hypothetical protein